MDVLYAGGGMVSGLIALAALCLVALPAQATPPASPCPYISFGWSQQWLTGTIQSAAYDSQAHVLYVVFRSQVINAFASVPIGVIQALTTTRDVPGYYARGVLPYYHMIMITETDNCPVLNENGAAYIYLD